MNLISTLSKTVHCFLTKIVQCFLHKLFLAFCIKLFFVQHYLENCSLSFLRKLFSVHYLKNSSLFPNSGGRARRGTLGLGPLAWDLALLALLPLPFNALFFFNNEFC